MTTQTLELSKQTIASMKQYYQDFLIKPVPYSDFRAKKNGVTITAYTSGKVLFQGNNAMEEATLWGESNNKKTSKFTESQANLPKNFDQWTIIGSDEVGNGSYFGALTVCAVYLPKEKQPLVKELGAKDSKLLTDKQIRDIAWQLKASVPYHLTICNPEKYNQAVQKLNAVSIKVSLHNFTINKLLEKLTIEEQANLQSVLIDQFTSENNYYKYLQKEDKPYKDKLYFAKKGESEHLAVACASIIARDAFLTSLETLGKPYHTVLPSGAGLNVDKFGADLIRQYGVQVLDKTAKLHFKNTQKIMKRVGK